MTISRRNLWLIGVIGAVFLIGLNQQHQRDIERVKESHSTYIEPPSKDTSYQTVRYYDFETEKFKNYTDTEIRMMRERESYKSRGTYIYTPARHVPTREEEIENYLEDNPIIMEEFHDKYRD